MKIAAKGFAILMLISGVALWASTPSAPPSDAAKTYLERAIALLQEKHINSETADWPRLKTNAYSQIGGAASPSDTYPAIQGVLDALKEKHSYFIPPINRAPAPPLKTESVSDSTGARPMPRGHIVDKRVGYVWLPQLNTIGPDGVAAGASYKQTLASLLMSLDDRASCGWIVDLRDNSGGNMWPMLNGLDPILGEQPFGYFAVKGGQAVPWVRTAYGIAPVSTDVAPGKPSFALKHAYAPVAVLIGPNTSSSGEMTALAFVGRSKVKTFGAPSYGFTTANTVNPLSDGAMLVITETSVRDRSGKNYSGAIIPDVVVPLENAEKNAASWIKKQCAPGKQELQNRN